MTGLERLRNVANAMRGYTVHGGGPLDLELMGIADQIERERLREVDDISGRDSDILAWVEEHGGIAELKSKLRDGERAKESVRRQQAHIESIQRTLSERVKRPAPKVLDSKGVECNVGDAVWWVRNKTGNFRIIRIEQYGKCAIHDDDADEPCGMTVLSTELTHERPVIDADGVEIREGDVLYSVETGDYVTVDSIEPGNPWFATTDGALQHCSKFIHRAPVLAADGVPIKAGDEVYGTVEGGPFIVIEVSDKGSVFVDAFPGTGMHGSMFTHAKPEIDSWERIEADAKLAPGDYIKMRGRKTDLYAYEEMPIDLVRRCKALAKAGK